MPRPRAHTTDELVGDAMRCFWQRGYAACSVEDLVQATGVSRHAIYRDVRDKRDLYLRGFEIYQREVVTPAFARVEAAGAGLAEIAAFLEAQIALAEKAGLPGPGCLVANATTETAPHDAHVQGLVAAHHARLKAGFRHALSTRPGGLNRKELDALAAFLVTTVQGLWSMSRVVETAAPLRAHAATLMSLLKARVGA